MPVQVERAPEHAIERQDQKYLVLPLTPEQQEQLTKGPGLASLLIEAPEREIDCLPEDGFSGSIGGYLVQARLRRGVEKPVANELIRSVRKTWEELKGLAGSDPDFNAWIKWQAGPRGKRQAVARSWRGQKRRELERKLAEQTGQLGDFFEAELVGVPVQTVPISSPSAQRQPFGNLGNPQNPLDSSSGSEGGEKGRDSSCGQSGRNRTAPRIFLTICTLTATVAACAAPDSLTTGETASATSVPAETDPGPGNGKLFTSEPVTATSQPPTEAPATQTPEPTLIAPTFAGGGPVSYPPEARIDAWFEANKQIAQELIQNLIKRGIIEAGHEKAMVVYDWGDPVNGAKIPVVPVYKKDVSGRITRVDLYFPEIDWNASDRQGKLVFITGEDQQSPFRFSLNQADRARQAFFSQGTLIEVEYDPETGEPRVARRLNPKKGRFERVRPESEATPVSPEPSTTPPPTAPPVEPTTEPQQPPAEEGLPSEFEYNPPSDPNDRLVLYGSPDGQVVVPGVGNHLRVEVITRQGEWTAIRVTNDQGGRMEAWAKTADLQAACTGEYPDDGSGGGGAEQPPGEAPEATSPPSSGTEMPLPEEITPSLSDRTPGRRTGEFYGTKPGREWRLFQPNRELGRLVYFNNDSGRWAALGRIIAIDKTNNQVTVVFNRDPNCTPNYDHGSVGSDEGGVVCGQQTYVVSSVWIRSALNEIGTDRFPPGFNGTIGDLEAGPADNGDLVYVIGSPSVVVEPSEGNNSAMIMGYQ